MKRMTVSLAILTCGLFAAGLAGGQTMDQKVIVATQLIHVVRAGAGGFSPEQRVARINERLNKIISLEPLSASNIHLRMTGADPGIYVGRYLVTTVTQADADANHTTPLALAHVWLREYRRVLPQARPGANWGVRG